MNWVIAICLCNLWTSHRSQLYHIIWIVSHYCTCWLVINSFRSAWLFDKIPIRISIYSDALQICVIVFMFGLLLDIKRRKYIRSPSVCSLDHLEMKLSYIYWAAAQSANGASGCPTSACSCSSSISISIFFTGWPFPV